MHDTDEQLDNEMIDRYVKRNIDDAIGSPEFQADIQPALIVGQGTHRRSVDLSSHRVAGVIALLVLAAIIFLVAVVVQMGGAG